jgi:hypothetical protein
MGEAPEAMALENAEYDAISKGDPGVAKYNNAAEVLSGNENLMNWDNGNWAAWGP